MLFQVLLSLASQDFIRNLMLTEMGRIFSMTDDELDLELVTSSLALISTCLDLICEWNEDIGQGLVNLVNVIQNWKEKNEEIFLFDRLLNTFLFRKEMNDFFAYILFVLDLALKKGSNATFPSVRSKIVLYFLSFALSFMLENTYIFYNRVGTVFLLTPNWKCSHILYICSCY